MSKLLILQLSDLHFTDKSSSFFDKLEQVRSVLRSHASTSKKLLVIFSGDLAQSGKNSEYELVKRFLLELRKGAVDDGFEVISEIWSVPGNHDCDFTLEPGARQMFLDNP